MQILMMWYFDSSSAIIFCMTTSFLHGEVGQWARQDSLMLSPCSHNTNASKP